MTKNEFYEIVMENYGPVETMIGMVPADKLKWQPGPTFMSAGQVICHVSDGLGAGLEWVLGGKWPSMEEMTEDMKLENLPSCSPQEGLDKLEKDKKTLRQILDGMSEEDFANKVVSVPWGWKGKMELMAIHFLEHFSNHKMQLFTYLKLLGLPVNTQTLYGM
jgi:uncharacterized damage-inducible protein DinB